LERTPEANIPLERPRLKCENNIKTGLKVKELEARTGSFLRIRAGTGQL
jgi:hypothetical protein